jgi:hypothetical protein
VLLGVLSLLAATGVSLVAHLRASTDDGLHRLAPAVAVVSALLLTAGLVVVQPDGVIGPNYYSAKALLALLLLGSVLAAAYGGTASLRNPVAGVAVVGIVLCCWSTRHAALPPRSAHTAGHLSGPELDALAARHTFPLPPGVEVWFADGCDRVGDLVASKWADDLSLTWSQGRASALESYADAPKGVAAIEDRIRDPSVHTVEVYAGRPCQSAAISRLALMPKVRVIRVEDGHGD